MKKILITGARSYIGTSFEKYLEKYDGYKVDTADMLDDSWRKINFGDYDAVFHVAGIAHIKETRKNAELFYNVNRDLAIETAQKAKAEGVSCFVILSSMSVYGINEGVVNKNTIPVPKTNYGKSKLEADLAIEGLQSESFRVAILRPPMVYGEGCKGNYQLLKKFALKSPVFPDYKNRRSMVHIDKLCEYVKKIIDESLDGYFYPQDDKYVCTAEMVEKIAKENGKNIKFVRWFNFFIKHCKLNIFKKVFGDLIYEDMK